jgi:hypothetical protein
MTDDDGEADAVPETYDPTSPNVPERRPPLRTTAPQSDFTGSQVAFGAVVLAIGLVVTFGLPILLT